MTSMKKYYSQLPLLLLLLYMGMGSPRPKQDAHSSNPTAIALQQISETSQKLAKAYDIHPTGEGMRQQFLGLEIYFKVYRKLTKEEAREIVLECTQEFLNDINGNEDLRPYLKEYPFTFSNVEIALYIENSDRTDIFHPDICIAACTPKGVEFITDDPEKKHTFKEIILESHEEALELLKAAQ
jgi:hypothetical protein